MTSYSQVKNTFTIVKILKKTFLQLRCSNDLLHLKFKDQTGAKALATDHRALRDLHNSSYDTKAEFDNCFIIHSK